MVILIGKEPNETLLDRFANKIIYLGRIIGRPTIADYKDEDELGPCLMLPLVRVEVF